VSKLGAARENEHVEVFMKEDHYVQDSCTRIEALMEKIFKAPQALVAAAGQFTYLLASKNDMEKFKKDLKKKAVTLELADF
jgi:hypothetical protein